MKFAKLRLEVSQNNLSDFVFESIIAENLTNCSKTMSKTLLIRISRFTRFFRIELKICKSYWCKWFGQFQVCLWLCLICCLILFLKRQALQCTSEGWVAGRVEGATNNSRKSVENIFRRKMLRQEGWEHISCRRQPCHWSSNSGGQEFDNQKIPRGPSVGSRIDIWISNGSSWLLCHTYRPSVTLVQEILSKNRPGHVIQPLPGRFSSRSVTVNL